MTTDDEPTVFPKIEDDDPAPAPEVPEDGYKQPIRADERQDVIPLAEDVEADL